MSQNSIQVFLSSWSILKHFDSLWIVSTMRPKASQCDLLKRPSLLVAYVGSVDAGLHRRHNPWPARNLKPSPLGPLGCLGFGVHQVCSRSIISSIQAQGTCENISTFQWFKGFSRWKQIHADSTRDETGLMLRHGIFNYIVDCPGAFQVAMAKFRFSV